MPRRTSLVFSVAVFAACSSTQTDSYQDEYVPYTDDCESGDDAKSCHKAAIIAEYHALEADKAGDRRAAARAMGHAADAAQRACDLGMEKVCDVAPRLRARQESL
ncbi:MAG: hypothetical protein AAGC53_20825 [Actinomycetota bacterium]